MNRISELEARIAADTAELERLKAEPDWERYRGMVTEFKRWSDNLMLTDKGIVNALLAARNHDPDVVALVEALRAYQIDPHVRPISGSLRLRADKALAPFAAIPLAAIKGD